MREENQLKVLIIGDIVGRPGLDRLKRELEARKDKVDFCIVNGENSASGRGLRVKEYNEILKDVNEEITSWVFDFLNKTFSSVNISNNKNQTGLEFIVILNNIYEKLEKSIKRIERFPKHSVINEYNLKNKNKCKVVGIKESIKHLRKNNTSTNLVEIRKNTTLDIFENQYVKYYMLIFHILFFTVQCNLYRMLA